jgi:hypothetical protein
MKTAVERVISNNYGFADVHGHMMAVAKQRLYGGPPRTDDEIKDIGRRLSVALRDVPIQEISVSNPKTGESYYPGLPPNFDQTKPEHAQILRDIITSNGFWEMAAHGEMVTLKVVQPGFGGFSVLDKNNQPLTIALERLPEFNRQDFIGTQEGGQIPVTVKEQPSKSYPLIFGQNWWNYLGIGSSNIKTNWPTRPSYITPPPK